MIFSVRRPQHFISHSKSQRSLVTRQRELGAAVVGTTKRWQRSLDRAARELNGGLRSHSLLQLFRSIDYWPLNRWPLNGGSTVYRVG